jgi:hypothetical protein
MGGHSLQSLERRLAAAEARIEALENALDAAGSREGPTRDDEPRN